ncbi:MAG: hypothetical protein JKY54_17935 [Flavobacteriales bacterium]|nr:hypothetical protein [Flavobacteriales bacterium]
MRKEAGINNKMVGCEDCGRWYHIQCANISEQTFDTISSSDSGWKCGRC